MNKCFHLVLLFYLIKQTFQRTDDYFSEDFDVNKNCQKESVIKKLLKEKQHERCSVTTEGQIDKSLINSFLFQFLKGVMNYSGKLAKKI